MKSYQQCTKCVMDTSASEISFDEDGICSFCKSAEELFSKFDLSAEERDKRFNNIFSQIKSANSKYDCILGMSGGVDSSYLAYLAWKKGLNPLVVHFDNGWNSEISVSNIQKILRKTGFDYEAFVIDWPEFRDLQRSFFLASVIDIEVLTDHAIFASLYKIAKKYGIKSLLSGANYQTEHGLPPSWVWRKTDLRNIHDIHKRFGSLQLKHFPKMGSLKFRMMTKLGYGLKYYEPLNYYSYSKQKAMETLQSEFDWVYYGGKHYESVFTKFYQAYYLPTKFGVDKRKVHLSSLVRSGEMTRESALNELQEPLYSEDELRKEKRYILKKLGFSDTEFENIMKSKPVPHLEFKSDERLFNFAKKAYNFLQTKQLIKEV